MTALTPRSTLTDTLCPYTTLFRSLVRLHAAELGRERHRRHHPVAEARAATGVHAQVAVVDVVEQYRVHHLPASVSCGRSRDGPSVAGNPVSRSSGVPTNRPGSELVAEPEHVPRSGLGGVEHFPVVAAVRTRGLGGEVDRLGQIGRAVGGGRVCQYVCIWVGAVGITKK